MALVIGLVAAAARAMSSNDHDRQQNVDYNGSRSNHNYNNGRQSGCTCNHNIGCSNSCNSNSSLYAAYSPQTRGSRRAERRMQREMRKAERKARSTDMLLSLMSGSQAASGSTGLSGGSAMHRQPVHGGGASYMGHGDNSRGRDVYPEAHRGMASGSEARHWRDEDAAFRSHDGPASSSEALPTYEQAVRRGDKSRR